MRIESLLRSLLAMFLLASAAWEEQSLIGDVSDSGTYQAADGTSDIPPPKHP